jgi:oligopeptide transport system substrate-binding protein
MAIGPFIRLALAGTALILSGCDERETGPIRVSAIGTPPQLRNPNLQPLDPPSAFLVEAAAQGLVRFDNVGEIEPALAQSWIVSDDGMRYTFRIRRAHWADGSPVTAEQVATRLRAAASRASRNPLKPVLGAIEDVVAMTDQVLEISLRGPRPNMLQLLAQPEMGILMRSVGTGPLVVAAEGDGEVRLSRPVTEDEEAGDGDRPDILLRGDTAGLAVARFAEDEADLVTGGTIGDLPIARAAGLPGNRLVFDPAPGLFGLAFAAAEEGPMSDPAVRRALSMAIDRQAMVAALAVPGLQPRVTLAPAIGDELPRPTVPDWATSPMPMRRELAARVIAAIGEPVQVRVAIPEGPGYRLIFAYLRRDWRMIGVDAIRVRAGAPADLRMIDAIAPETMAIWYLRQFSCEARGICDPAADTALQAARVAPGMAERQAQIMQADELLSRLVPFIPLGTPIRWSLVAPRLTGFRPSPFARHPAGTLIAPES